MILTTDSEFSISETNIPAKPAALQQLADMQTPTPVPVPPAPTPPVQIVDEQTPESAVDSVVEQEDTPVTATPTQTPSDAGSTKSDTTIRGWVVQVASFSEQDKAITLRDRLRKAKYPSFVESVTAKHSQLFRVRVGPVVRREHAEEWQKKIAKDFKVPDALVMAHPG